MLMTQGGQTLVNSVKPAGDSTPARPDAAANHGFALRGAVWRPGHSYGMRTLVRIQPWGWRGRGVAGVVPAMSSAVVRSDVRGAASTAYRGGNGERG